jgi:hypothetical protein
MNGQALIARDRDRDVWEAARDLEYRDPSKTYFVLAGPSPASEP